MKIVIFHYFRHFFSSLESSFVDAIISFLQYFLSLIKRRFPWLIQFSPREEGGKKGKNAKYSHFHQGQVPLEQKPSWTTSRNFFKNFALYINVLRIRFGVETTLTDRYMDIWMDWTNLLMVARLVSWPKEVVRMEFQLIPNRRKAVTWQEREIRYFEREKPMTDVTAN